MERDDDVGLSVPLVLLDQADGAMRALTHLDNWSFEERPDGTIFVKAPDGGATLVGDATWAQPIGCTLLHQLATDLIALRRSLPRNTAEMANVDRDAERGG